MAICMQIPKFLENVEDFFFIEIFFVNDFSRTELHGTGTLVR